MLVYVIVIMALIAPAMYVLTVASASLANQTYRMRVEAHRRNLEASGLAWAKHSARAGGKDKTAALDVTHIQAPDGKLNVTVSQAPDGRARVRIRTYCRRGKHVTERDAGYFLDGP